MSRQEAKEALTLTLASGRRAFKSRAPSGAPSRWPQMPFAAAISNNKKTLAKSVSKRILQNIVIQKAEKSSKMELEEESTMISSSEKDHQMIIESTDQISQQPSFPQSEYLNQALTDPPLAHLHAEKSKVTSTAANQFLGPTHCDPLFQTFTREHLQQISDNERRLQQSSGKSLQLEQQPEICERMRMILVDWMLEVSSRFNLKAQTVFLAVSLLDAYTRHNIIQRTRYQLLGVTVLFTASKFEEIRPPCLKDFVYICDRSVTKEEILQQEKLLLETTDFRLFRASALSRAELSSAQGQTGVSPFGMYFLFLALLGAKIQTAEAADIARVALRLGDAAERGERGACEEELGRELWKLAEGMGCRAHSGLRTRFPRESRTIATLLLN